MLSNLLNQLKQANAEGQTEKVLSEVSVVKKGFRLSAVGNPTSQIVGTQALLNMLTGRYRSYIKEPKGLLKGEYGALPEEVNEEIRRLTIDGDEVIACYPADRLGSEHEKIIEVLPDQRKISRAAPCSRRWR